MMAAEDERLSGQALVALIESTPCDDASDIDLQSDFLPLLKEVLGKVPGIVLQGAEEADRELQQAEQASAAAAPSTAAPAVPASGNAAFHTEAGGRAGSVSFSRPGSAGAEGEVTSSSPTGVTAAPAIRVDDATLAAVAKTIMGRLDIVDLVGRNTAMEAAERVRDALMDPATAQRLKAVRQYAERDDAPFPPQPVEAEVSGPLLGEVSWHL